MSVQDGIARDTHPRSTRLLLRHLDDLQRRDFRVHGMFIVIGKLRRHDGYHRRYLLAPYTVAEIAPTLLARRCDYVVGGFGYRQVKAFCVVEDPHGERLLMNDRFLVWKLMIETDEREFRRIGSNPPPL